jgi:hypothetical protein
MMPENPDPLSLVSIYRMSTRVLQLAGMICVVVFVVGTIVSLVRLNLVTLAFFLLGACLASAATYFSAVFMPQQLILRGNIVSWWTLRRHGSFDLHQIASMDRRFGGLQYMSICLEGNLRLTFLTSRSLRLFLLDMARARPELESMIPSGPYIGVIDFFGVYYSREPETSN